MRIEHVRDAASDAVADYARLTDVALRSITEPERGIFIAESAKVIRRAIDAGCTPRSVLMEEKWLPGLEAALDPFAIPVHLADPAQLEAITGYRVHRGALAAFERPALPAPADLLATARRVVAALIDQFGFDVVDAGPLQESWRIQRDTPGYGPRRNADELRKDLAAATR